MRPPKRSDYLLAVLLAVLLLSLAWQVGRISQCFPDPCSWGPACDWACQTPEPLPAREG